MEDDAGEGEEEDVEESTGEEAEEEAEEVEKVSVLVSFSSGAVTVIAGTESGERQDVAGVAGVVRF